MKIKKAVILVAGFGSRMLPATKALPKAMLPIYNTPIIEKLVDEALSIGADEIILITDKYKKAIEDHFDSHEILEQRINSPKKKKYYNAIMKYSDLNITYIRQKKLNGDGDAILHAAHLIEDEPCLVLFGDDILENTTSGAKQLLEVYNKTAMPVVGVVEVPKDSISSYGIVETNDDGKIQKFIEKPSLDQTDSNLAAVGKYIITPEIIKNLRNAESTAGDGEIRLADALTKMTIAGSDIMASKLIGERYDTGSMLGYTKAFINEALKDDAINSELKEWIKDNID